MKTIFTLVLLATINMATAQTIDKQVVSSGGETISNANHTLTFTIGEPIIGKVENGAIINQGFLAGAASGSTLAVDEQLLSTAIKVYPNPVADNLNIDLNDVSGETKILIYNSLGQFIKTEKLTATNNSINVDQLQSGLYLVNLHFTDYKTIKTFKIIKK
ncbi:T9SS type A sorting domain-containing protein [Aureibaculum sp. A20]|uniref:T9SS type A sorting domain-containing protein n=1 Tax=Aureibaculum flavum TaxID=2795986 RepID=A0ABS0WMN7_9FLAO|nr:T9SS type A sorting domain-containing protein [Aureibaculum flavum]MBJ2173214.1 T9SS type A sorting domain-containing protein [Aureibaculum flavum]